MEENKPVEKIIAELKERAKELNCLYSVQEILNKTSVLSASSLTSILNKIPPGFQYPEITHAKIDCPLGKFYSDNFTITQWVLNVDIIVQEEKIGSISVSYEKEMPESFDGPFLREEIRLMENIAERIGLQMLHEQLKIVFESRKTQDSRAEWAIVLDMLAQTNPKLLVRLSRKMINYLCWTGVNEADSLLHQFSPLFKSTEIFSGEVNKPFQHQDGMDIIKLSYDIFTLAGNNISQQEIISNIQKWTKEDRSGFLSEVLENPGSSLNDISTAVERYHHLSSGVLELTGPRRKAFSIALIRRILTDQFEFIQIAKNNLEIEDFTSLFHNLISPLGSYGKLGGKSSGLILAKKILKKASEKNSLLAEIKTPRTWYLTSDGLLNFMSYNNLDEILEQKHKDFKQVQQEYPYVVHVFKNSMHSPEIVKGLLMALEDFGDSPLIIRSSSLLEDRIGSVSAGKYKSLFIANQGGKEEKLKQLCDAISEVYASTFGPDPIGYRARNNLLDFHEEMGVMIQEVVGTRVGPYFLPAFAGLAFSRNQYRWSNRIRVEDGLVRMVPGLGTRAVDRLKDDYPVLLSPGQPGLRVNVGMDEILRYSPKFIDLINLDTAKFETLAIDSLLKRYGKQYPMFSRVISVIKQGRIQPARPLGTDFRQDDFVVNFEGLVIRTDFLKLISCILKELELAYKHAIDIEFAHDGKSFYLLQCRSQCRGGDNNNITIPEIPDMSKCIFTANKYIWNGMLKNIKYIVYVDPEAYAGINNHQELLDVGLTVGMLNNQLKNREFILIGPGRWGSRGDIKLGVNVTYSDITKTAALVEIARKKDNYIPDLSFGTHFFQDLIESDIKYIPLYPDENGNVFNEGFFKNSRNILTELIPEMKHIENVVRLIDIGIEFNNKKLSIYMDSEIQEALAIIE